MDRGKDVQEVRGKGKRLRQATGSEGSEICWVNAFADTLVPLSFEALTVVITGFGNVI